MHNTALCRRPGRVHSAHTLHLVALALRLLSALLPHTRRVFSTPPNQPASVATQTPRLQPKISQPLSRQKNSYRERLFASPTEEPLSRSINSSCDPKPALLPQGHVAIPKFLSRHGASQFCQDRKLSVVTRFP